MAGSSSKKYTIAKLISDLGSCEANYECASKQMEKIDGRSNDDSKNSPYVEASEDYRNKANRISSRINKQPGVEQLRLVCNSGGKKWSKKWVEQQWATWCFSNDRDQSSANTMTVANFAILMRPKQTKAPELSGNAFEQLLADFRQAWIDLGRVYHMIDVYAPDSYDSRNPPFDREKCDVIAQVCMPVVDDMPVTPDMYNSTLIGFAVIEKQRDNLGAADRIRELFNRAGAALPLQFEPVVGGLCPWYMSEPATRWLALMLIATGTTARSPKGKYIGKAILEKPLQLSVHLIEAYKLDTDEPITVCGGEGMPVYTGEDEESGDSKGEAMLEKSENPALSRLKYDILQAMHELGANTPEARQTTDQIAMKAEGPAANVNKFKLPLSKLKDDSYIKSKVGRGGGYWLLEKGKSLSVKRPC